MQIDFSKSAVYDPNIEATGLKALEWFAQGEGLKQIVHQDILGQWNRDEQFWSNPSPLGRLEGVVSHIRGPEAGEIETLSGLKAFYVPGMANHYKGEAENRRVKLLPRL